MDFANLNCSNNTISMEEDNKTNKNMRLKQERNYLDSEQKPLVDIYEEVKLEDYVMGTKYELHETNSNIEENEISKDETFHRSKDQKKREREANWSAFEKEFLRECVMNHLSVVEDRGNDNSMIKKKKNAWKAIKQSMASAGFDRDISKLKSQWVRMKVRARKAGVSVTTTNPVAIPELNAEDDLEQGTILQEVIENDNFSDSSSQNKIDGSENRISGESETLEDRNSGENCHNRETETNQITTPEQCSPNVPEIKTANFSSKLKRLRSIHKVPNKNDIILERQRQIAKESSLSEEINKLKKKQLMSEIDHMERMHKMQEIQQEEIHSLKLKQLQMQIEHDREIHDLNVRLLRKKLSS